MIKIKIFKLNFKLCIIFLIVILTLSSILIYNTCNAEEKNFIEVPIIMYHSVLKGKSGEYIISPEVFESDMKKINEKGYETVFISDLINYVYEDGELPAKPIVITFDDGFYNNLEYALPILEKYDMKAVISIVGIYTDKFTEADEANSLYGHLRWKDIKDMMQKGNIEFQNHTYDLHKIANGRKGIMKKKNESLEKYESVISNDILKLQQEFEENTGYIPNTFTYPYGAISKESKEILKKLGFKATLSCKDGVNHITKNQECLYELKRYDRKNKR